MPTAAAGNAIVREIRAHGPKPAGPCAMIIFGVTGDLSKRLLLPALYNLASIGLLSEHFALVGYAMPEIREEQVREALAANLRQACGRDSDSDVIEWLVSRVRFIASDFASESGWQSLTTF